MKDAGAKHTGAENTSAENEEPTGRRPTRWAMLAVGAVLLALIATAGWKSAGNLDAARQQESELLHQIDGANLRIESLESRLSRLDQDPATLERLAREELGMVRPGDVVIVLPAESASNTPVPR